MKKLIGLIIAFLFSNHVAFCGQQGLEQPQPFATNGMLIFLDNQEKEISAVSMGLIAAIDQKSGSILASSSLFKTILFSPNLDELSHGASLNAPEKELVNLANKEFIRINQQLKKLIKKTQLTDTEKTAIIQTIKPIAIEGLQKITFTNKSFAKILNENKNLLSNIYRAAIKSSLSFNPNEWIIKQVNQHLLLLIPKQEIQKKQQLFNQIPDSQTFTKLELSLGLKIDHMQNVDSLSEFVKNYVAPNNVEYFLPSLPEIFITNQEYAQVNQQSNTKMQLPTWAIYMLGHGSPGNIVQLTINEFKSLLDFLETKIKTTLFAYVSCFGAGANSEAVYKDIKTGIYKTYPFTIITAALIDAPIGFSSLIFPLVNQDKIDSVQKKIKPLFYNFADFINYVTSNSHIDFAKAFSYVWLTPTTQEYISSSPQIKLAGIPWFNVADTQKNLVSLGKIMTQTRTQPLNVTQFFKTQPMGILLQTPLIPYPVTIDMISMPALVSMLPGNTTHAFKELNIPNITFKQFIDSFEPLKKILNIKTYYFFTLTVKNDLSYIKGQSRTTTYRNIIITLHNPSLNSEPHTGIFVYAYGKNPSIRWFDQKKQHMVSTTDDAIVQYNFDANSWNEITDNNSKELIKKQILFLEESMKQQEGNLSKQLGITPRKEKPQKLVLPKGIPGQEKPVEPKPVKEPVPLPIIPTPKTAKPAKPAFPKITPAIAPKQKPVAKQPAPQKAPAGKVPTPKKLSPAALKKAKLSQAKKARQKAIAKKAELKKQQQAKAIQAKKQAALKKKAAIKGKKVIKKKPVVQKKKAAKAL